MVGISLESRERAFAVAYLHWIVLIPSLAVLFVGLAVLSAAIVNRTKEIGIIGGFIIAVASVFLVSAVVDYIMTELAVTNRRIILRRGLLRRITIEQSIENAEKATVTQNALGRTLDYGTIDLGFSAATFPPLHRFADPQQVRSAILQGIKLNKHGRMMEDLGKPILLKSRTSFRR